MTDVLVSCRHDELFSRVCLLIVLCVSRAVFFLLLPFVSLYNAGLLPRLWRAVINTGFRCSVLWCPGALLSSSSSAQSLSPCHLSAVHDAVIYSLSWSFILIVIVFYPFRSYISSAILLPLLFGLPSPPPSSYYNHRRLFFIMKLRLGSWSLLAPMFEGQCFIRRQRTERKHPLQAVPRYTFSDDRFWWSPSWPWRGWASSTSSLLFSLSPWFQSIWAIKRSIWSAGSFSS